MAQTKWLLKGSIIIIYNMYKIVKKGEVNGEEEEVLGTYANHHQQGASAKKAAANPIWIHKSGGGHKELTKPILRNDALLTGL